METSERKIKKLKLITQGGEFMITYSQDFFKIHPYNKFLEEVVDEMISDIGEFDIDYFQENFEQTSNMYVSPV